MKGTSRDAMFVIDNRLYFGGKSAAGTEPWVSDGTSAGTQTIANLMPYAVNSHPILFTATPNNKVMFFANTPEYGIEPLIYDRSVASDGVTSAATTTTEAATTTTTTTTTTVAPTTTTTSSTSSTVAAATTSSVAPTTTAVAVSSSVVGTTTSTTAAPATTTTILRSTTTVPRPTTTDARTTTTLAPVTTTSVVSPTTVAPTTTTPRATTTVAATVPTVVSTTSLPAAGEVERVTIPRAPIDGAVLDRVAANQPIAVVDGVVAEVTVVQSPSSLTMSVGGVSVEAKAGSGTGNELALTPDGRLRMVGGKSIAVSAKGFAPRSTVQLWVYQGSASDETYIGSFESNDDGSIDLDVDVPGDLDSGSADLVVAGTNTSGSKLVVGVPVSIEYDRDVAGFGWSVLAGLLFAVGGVFTFLVMRRQSLQSEGD